MAFDAFLKIDGIPGESTDDKHKDWIEILSYSHAVSQPVHAAQSATGAHTTGRVDVADFSIVKSIDKASPKLGLACCTGEHIPTVVFELCRAGGDKQTYMEYKLQDVIIGSVRPGGSAHGEGLPLEEVGLRMGKINWTYTPIDKAGKPQGKVPTGWDMESNKKI